MLNKLMSKRATLGALLGVFFASFGVIGAAEAKEPVILVIDQERLISTSKAGKSVSTQLLKLQEAATKEVEGAMKVVGTEAEALKGKQATMEKTAFATEARKIAVKQQNAQGLREIRVRELSIAEQRAMAKISETLRPILKSVVEQRGATILLDRNAVMYVNPDADITDDVLKQLDKKITTVRVVKVDLQAEAEKYQKAQQAAAKK